MDRCLNVVLKIRRCCEVGHGSAGKDSTLSLERRRAERSMVLQQRLNIVEVKRSMPAERRFDIVSKANQCVDVKRSVKRS